MCLADRGDEFLVLDVLGDIAAGSSLERLGDVFGGLRRGEHEHAGTVRNLPDASQRLDAVDALHGDVEQADIGAKFAPQPHALCTVTGLADDAEARLGIEQVGEAGPHHRVVVDEQQADDRGGRWGRHGHGRPNGGDASASE